MQQVYKCMICDNTSEQKGHHNAHLKTEKHDQKKTILKLKLEKLSQEELIKEYSSDDIMIILKNLETHKMTKILNFIKKDKTNIIIKKKSENQVLNNIQDKNFKDLFINFLGQMHNLLRGSAVTGDQALDDILYALFLCYLDKNKNNMKLFEYNSYYADLGMKRVNEYKQYLSIDYLIHHTEELRITDSYSSIVKCARILSRHPKTELLFKKDEDFFNCQDTATLCRLLMECDKFSNEFNIFEQIDIIGLAYEYMTTKHAGNGGVSREMGQYFTERPLMYSCFQLIDKEDINDLQIDNNSTIGDEFCATLGFPIYLKKYLKDMFSIEIQDKNIYGIEYHERLSRFALMNAIFSMNDTSNIKRANSFYTNITPHLDISVHNVPFGKSMSPDIIKKNYLDLKEANEYLPTIDEYLPFCKHKVDAILASQVVLYKTRKMGLLILKDGEETSSKKLGKYRKWFGEQCMIKKILKIPPGAFTCTNTKTICLYFIKKKGHSTDEIQFLELNETDDTIFELCKVSLEDMKSNHYSWDGNSYIKDLNLESLQHDSKCSWKALGELCNILPTTKHYTKIGLKEGNYRFYNSSQQDKLYLNSYEVDCESIIIGNGGELCIHYDEQFTASKHVSVLQNIDRNIVNLKFIYYYLLFNINILKAMSTGGGIQWLNKEKILSIQIPIISMEKQNDVIEVIEQNQHKIKELNNEIVKCQEMCKNALLNSFK